MRHIIAETTVGNVAADRAGHIRCPGRYGGDGFSGQCGAVTSRHTAESPTDKAVIRSTGAAFLAPPSTTASADAVRIALETVGKACGEPHLPLHLYRLRHCLRGTRCRRFFCTRPPAAPVITGAAVSGSMREYPEPVWATFSPIAAR